jgi:hypothetical protein
MVRDRWQLNHRYKETPMPTDDRLPVFNACDGVRVKNLFAIFFFSLTIPGLVRYCLFNEGPPATAKEVSQISSYVLLFVLSAKYTGLSRVNLVGMMNFRIKPKLILILGLGVGLFGFVLGENALEVWVISNFNEELGYSLWPFRHVEHVHNLSPSLYLFLISTIIAPLAEEFFFSRLAFFSACSVPQLGRCSINRWRCLYLFSSNEFALRQHDGFFNRLMLVVS